VTGQVKQFNNKITSKCDHRGKFKLKQNHIKSLKDYPDMANIIKIHDIIINSTGYRKCIYKSGALCLDIMLRITRRESN